MENKNNGISGLLNYIDRVRVEMNSLVEKIDPNLEICPGWRIKEVLGHITAWEIVIDKALLAYQAGDPPYFLHEQDFDEFNREAVEYRANWSLEQVIREWKDARVNLIKTIQKLKEEDLPVEIVLPWGSERTIYELIEIIDEHESEHIDDIKKAKR
jgi:hypothetical protein